MLASLVSFALIGCGAETETKGSVDSQTVSSTSSSSGSTEIISKYQEGIHYLKIEEPVKELKGEVSEFVWFNCVYCLAVQGSVDDANQKHEGAIKQYHSQLSPLMQMAAQFDFAVRGLLPETANEIKKELLNMGVDGDLKSPDDYYEFLETKGLEKDTIDQYLSTPEVLAEMEMLASAEKAAKFTGTPSFLIDGQYVLNLENISSWNEAFEVIDFLIEDKLK